ncbi:hypothetical protein GCM10028784_06510 [Myceligenerans cantabricum]
MAIERREAGVVQDGLDVYKNVIEAILDEQLRLGVAAGNETSPNLPLGREWEQVLRDLHGVVDSVAASSSRLLWIDVISWVRRVAETCADRAVLNALGHILSLVESAWIQEISTPSRDATARQDALLLRLSEFGNFYLSLRKDESDSRGAGVIYTRTFLQIIKHAIESGDTDAASVAIEYFLYGSTSARGPINPVTGAGLLALYAWILYRFDRGEQDDSFKAVCNQITQAFKGSEAFVPLLRASDDLESELGLHWWELHGRGPVRGGSIQIGTYMLLALMLIGGARLIWEQLDPTSEDDIDVARRLMAVIDSFKGGSFAGAQAALALPDNQFERLKEHLVGIVQQSDVIVEENNSQLPVEPDRVSAFRTALREKLSTERENSLTVALLTPGDLSAEPTKPNFGLDTLIPRWYFAKTRVFADPANLADDLVDGLVRGEQDRILDRALGDLSGAAETTLDGLANELEAAISAAQSSSPIVVTNSYQAHALLTGRPAGVTDQSPHPVTAALVKRVYDDRPAYVALLSPQGLPTVHLRPLATNIDGDEPLEDLHVIVGVSELSQQEMDEIVGREERTRVDEARLRGSLRIRLLEHLEVVMAPDVHPMIWTLPDPSW